MLNIPTQIEMEGNYSNNLTVEQHLSARKIMLGRS